MFESRLASVADGQWRLPTPCIGWNVRDLVGHVTAGNRMAVGLLARHEIPNDDGDMDTVSAFVRSAQRQDEAFTVADPRALVEHPAGRVSVREFAIYRCGDIVVHGWDLARAIGADDSLDPELVQQVLAPYVGWVQTLDSSGEFTEPSQGARGERRQDQLLRQLGRHP
jgi:uncharacterized protein (TIGR03086 family)